LVDIIIDQKRRSEN